MIETQVIIVGGGPAGSTCAWELNRNGINTIIVDKNDFPRTKLCAGWITPKVLTKLEMKDYPHSLIRFNRLHYHFFNLRVPVRTEQYSIRRFEFDHWLLRRAGVPVYRHEVCHIERSKGTFVIDNRFRCTYLVGAGGTYCPVYRSFFKDRYPRLREGMITTLEQEFEYDYGDNNCYLWFFDRKLPGYAWYVPKGDGYLNIGIGGNLAAMKSRKTNIGQYWSFFIQKLDRLSLVRKYRFHPRGYNYYLRQKRSTVQLDRVFLVGDAAGLATRDMGEGIGPAVESGLGAAEAITRGCVYSIEPIPSYSMPGIVTSNFFRRRARILMSG
jgi:flavin-dependent dehydrogenase